MPENIKWFTETGNLCEIYQAVGMYFSFLSSPKDENKQCHCWVKCRDFLHDALRAQINNSSCSIYAFDFNVNINPPIDLKRTRMLVKFKNYRDFEKQKKIIQSAKKLLNFYEELAGSTFTKVSITTDKDDVPVWIFNGPAFWQKAPFLISMFTLLIRLGDKELVFQNLAELISVLKEKSESTDATKDNDIKYLSVLYNKLNIIVENWRLLADKKLNLFSDGVGIGLFHNNYGVLSLAKLVTPNKELNNAMKTLLSNTNREVKC